MDTSSLVVIVGIAIAIISYSRKMRKSWDEEATTPLPNLENSDETDFDSPYTHYSKEITEENLEEMPILDSVENFKFTQYTPPVFIPTTGSFDAVTSEDDLISSFDYDDESVASHANSITDFDLKKAVIYSEILKPKWNS